MNFFFIKKKQFLSIFALYSKKFLPLRFFHSKALEDLVIKNVCNLLSSNLHLTDTSRHTSAKPGTSSNGSLTLSSWFLHLHESSPCQQTTPQRKNYTPASTPSVSSSYGSVSCDPADLSAPWDRLLKFSAQ